MKTTDSGNNLIRFPGRMVTIGDSSGKHTPGHLLCPACDELQMADFVTISPDQTFPDAFRNWINSRILPSGAVRITARYISERTEWDYRQYARALEKQFLSLRLRDIHVGHLREYHRARATCDGAWCKPAGANRIRKEVALLVRILQTAGCWTDNLERFFEPLQVEDSDVQRALSPAEQNHFLEVAGSRAEWSFVLHYAIAALQTCCSTNELRSLRLGDVQLSHATITIRKEGAKNKYRRRSIPLESGEVLWAFERLIERARELGAASPTHYLFPIGVRRHEYDPTRPMSDSGLKKRWDDVRRAAGLPWLRPYDLRHTAITRMAEAGVPIAVIMSFAGHMSLKMQQHYTTISMMAMRKASQSTWSRPSVGCRDIAVPARSGT